MSLANKTQELTSRDDATGEARALDTRLAAQRQRRWAAAPPPVTALTCLS